MPRSYRNLRLAGSPLALILILLSLRTAAAAPIVYGWAEGERPASANFPFDAQETALPQLLSNGKWLFKSVEKADLAKSVPAEGFMLEYRIGAPEDGDYQVWARVGYEHVRAPIEWRIGNGPWTRVGPEAHTTSLMRLGFWSEVAWLDLGSATLKAGMADLQLRVKEPGSSGGIILALDALALVKGRWVPEGRLKPGQSYDGPEDRAAAEHRFIFPASLPEDRSARVVLPLDGLWQVARYDDPNMDAGPYAPVEALPMPDDYPLRWMGVKTPSSAWDQPELAFGHRLLYRARVDVPASMKGRSFALHFSGTNWIASVFINGVLAGTHQGVLVPWDLDISRQVRPGETNEIVVGIKSPWYAFDTVAKNSRLEETRNLPDDSGPLSWSRWIAPIYPSSKGEGDGTAYGLVNPVKLTVAGPAYVSDVFVRTSVTNHRLDADVTVSNPSPVERNLTLKCEAVSERTGQVEAAFPPVGVTVPPGGEATKTVGGPWAHPRLWWPVDHADMYTLRTTVAEAGAPLDVDRQPFGFHEVTTDGIHLKLNGTIRNFWNWVEVSGDPSSPQEWLKAFRTEGDRYYRFASDSMLRRFLPNREERLDFFDRNGVPGRLSTCIDGMFITYDLHSPLVWENFKRHFEQVTRAYRNHPSIMMYSFENELMYINAQNIYGGEMDQMEAKALAIARAGQANDPTRPMMTDGGGAMKSNAMPINCEHYPEAAVDAYPDNAYTMAEIGDHSSRWPWDRLRPMIFGETFFYAGKLEDQAWIGGDEVFRGRDEANVGASRFAQLLVEGSRWQGIAGICPWVSLEHLPGAKPVFSDLIVITRKRALRAYAGRPAAIDVKVLNDTLTADPVTFEWAVFLGARRIAGRSETLRIEPGLGQEEMLRFAVPVVESRAGATLLLRLTQDGKVGFEKRAPLAVFPEPTSLAPPSAPLYVYDRSGKLLPYLRAHRARPVAIASLDRLAGKSGLLLVGPDTLTGAEAYSPRILAFAARGGRAIVLEQEVPLAGMALPAPVRPTAHYGGYAFPQALGLPLFAGLTEADFTDWAGDAPTFKRAYLKPAGGARSLVECGAGLNDSAMIEAPAGRGVIVSVQLRVGAKLGIEPAADRLLANLLACYGSYAPRRGVAAVLAPGGSPIAKAVAATGILASTVTTLAAALDPSRFRVVVLPATPEHLRALLAAPALVSRFNRAGGWIMLWGLTPAGLTPYHRLVGGESRIRPFRLERVTLESPESPLAATLGNRDLTMYGTKEIGFGDYFLSENVYSYVVGGSDVAPFCKMPDGPDDPFKYQPTFSDNDPYNYVNGMFNSDSWQYIRQIGVGPKGSSPLVFGFRQPATIRQVDIWNNVNYMSIEDLDLIFDGDAAHPVHATLPANGSINEIKIDPPRRVTKSITLAVRSWRPYPAGTDPGKPSLAGIDNLRFLRVVSPSEARAAHPLDNIGGLVAYPRGAGGILLNQIKLMEDEPNPENAAKKIRLVSTLLQNMGAGSRSGEVAVPGVNVRYTPLDLTRFANRHIKAQGGQAGWFGDLHRDLSQFRVGQQYLADILYHVPDYVNAPVPQSIIVAGPNSPEPLRLLPAEVKGIPVGRTADALYFLQAAEVTNPISEGDLRRPDYRAPELFHYVVHYADGATAEIPVRIGEEVDDWLQKRPHPLPDAQVGWSEPFSDARAGDPRAVVYSTAWTNPRPGISIASIDIVRGPDGDRGVPAVLGITVGERVR